MLKKERGTSNKVYFAIILLVVLIVASAAIIYATTQGATKPLTVGLNIGDTFTYSLKGTSNLGLGATPPSNFNQYNDTDYYKITVTSVNGSQITIGTEWKFLNGTAINDQQIIDLANGNKVKPDGFWAVYASNLNVNDLLRPQGFDGVKVNATDTQTYATSMRARNFFFMENEFYDVNDPTHNTLRYDYTGVYFDKQTGMLETLSNYQEYNNPQMVLVITWKLVSSSVWDV
jgi:hypothetical protein